MKYVLIVAPFTSLPGEIRNNRFQQLSERLSSTFRVRLVTSQFRHFDKTQRTRAVECDNFQVQLIPEPGYRTNASIARLFSHSIFCRNLKAYLDSAEKPDLVYSAYPMIGSNLVLGEWCRRHGIPLVIDVQDVWPESFTSVMPGIKQRFNDILKPLKKRADRAYQQASAIVAVSNTYLERAMSVCKGDQEGLCVYIGSDDLLIDDIEPVEAEAGVFHAVYIGTISHSYDLATVVKAAALLKNSSIQISIIGEGPQRSKLEALNKSQGEPVRFTGILEYKDMIATLKSADVAINALKAGAPQSITNKLSDYFSVGLPILSSQVCPEARSLITATGAGLDYPPGNPRALAQTLRELAEKPEICREMSAASRAVGDKYFRRSETYEAIVQLIERQHLGKEQGKLSPEIS